MTEDNKLDPEKLRESCKAHAESEEFFELSERAGERAGGYYWGLAATKRSESDRLMLEADPELHGPTKEVGDVLERDNFVPNEQSRAKVRALLDRAEALVRLRCAGPTS